MSWNCRPKYFHFFRWISAHIQNIKKKIESKSIHNHLYLQCYQSIETNIGDHFYERTKLKLANRALWVARKSSEEDPMTFIFDETLNLCEPEKFGESFASCRPATEGKKAGSINLYSISNYLLQMCFVDLWIIPLWIKLNDS